MGEYLSDYDVRSPASRTLLTVLATVVVVGGVAGVVLGVSLLMKDTKAVTSVVELGESTQLVVNATDADITIVQGDEDDAVTVRARVTSGLGGTDYELGRRGDELKVSTGCRTWLTPGCGVQLTLEVPKGLPLVVTTTSGDLTAEGRDGLLTLRSASGEIVGTDLEVDEFTAETSSGDIRAEFAAQPFAIKADSDSGDIMAVVPTGKRTYAVSATSKEGAVDSELTSDSDGEGFVRAITTSGDVMLAER